MNAALFLGLKYNKITITLSEACAELGIASATGFNQVSRGEFPIPSRIQGKNRVVDVRDLAEYFERQRKDSRDAFGL